MVHHNLALVWRLVLFNTYDLTDTARSKFFTGWSVRFILLSALLSFGVLVHTLFENGLSDVGMAAFRQNATMILIVFLPVAAAILGMVVLATVSVSLFALTGFFHLLYQLIEDAVAAGLPKGHNSFGEWLWAILNVVAGFFVLCLALTVASLGMIVSVIRGHPIRGMSAASFRS